MRPPNLSQLAATCLLAVAPAALRAQDAPALPPGKPDQLPAGLPAVAAAYAAKVTASARFVSQRSLASVRREELAPDAPIQAMIRPFLQLEVDADAGTVTASLLGQRAVATFVPGIGCTLATGDDLRRLRHTARAAPAALPPDPRAWPLGDALPDLPIPDGVDAAALDAAIAYGSAEPDGRPLARTRAIVVVHRGRLLAERYAEGYDARSVLPGWSMTKSWVDALLGLRVQDGALDPAAELPVPEWRRTADDPRRALRLDDLLRMQSGLAWVEDYEAADSDALRMLFGSRDHGAVAADKPLAAPPRRTFCYSSGTTNLLCRVLRSTFADEAAALHFARRRLFQPLGMDSARIEADPSGTPVGSSYGFATARDWAKVALLYLQDGVWDGKRLLPHGWVAQSLTATASTPRGNFGRHWWLNRGRDDAPSARPFSRLPRDVFYMSGYEGQYVVCFPTQQLIVVRLGCTKRGGYDLHGFLERVAGACGG